MCKKYNFDKQVFKNLSPSPHSVISLPHFGPPVEKSWLRHRTSWWFNPPSLPTVDEDDEDDEMEGDEEWEDVEGDEIPVTDCLFCGRSSSSMEDNLQHMTVSHSFFLPNVEYLVDMEGMLEYLGKENIM